MAVITGDDGTPSGFVPDPTRTFGVWGDSGSAGAFGGGGNGVLGSSKFYTGVAGFSLSPRVDAAGVFGSGSVGVCGFATGALSFPGGKVGVYGSGANARSRAGAIGVLGQADTNVGVSGESVSNAGVAGVTQSGVGVRGVSFKNIGVFGIGTDTGMLGWGGTLGGLFIGDVQITGNLMKGGGGFMIDHPRDPANRYLRHSFVESAEMKNVYDGVARCNSKGEAIVRLPDWFEALNSDYRYQLTAIGASAPNLFIASGVKNGRFSIAGGRRGLLVSWQVTGIRKDPWAKAHGIVVDEKKPASERGKYLHADAHGVAAQRAVHYAVTAQARQHLTPTKTANPKAKAFKRRDR